VVPAAELEGRPLADLHQLAADSGVPRYRLLRREQLVAALSGGEVPVAVAERPPAPPERPRRERPREERPPRPERPPRRAQVKSLEELEGGRAPTASVPSTPFDDLPVQRPTRPLALGDSVPARMVELVAPLGYGQRALISGPLGSGSTFLLRELGRALAQEGAQVTAVLVDVRPEEVPEWGDGLDVVAADTGTSPREQVALAEDVLARAKEAAARGEDAVLLLDSLSRLARAYGLTGDRVEAVESTKRWFAAARDAGEGAGSLTLIAAARVESESSLEALVHETLADSANMMVRLNAELAERGRYPAIDVTRSRTLGEEALLSEDRRRTLENMRGVARSLDTLEAWDFLEERAREGS
jgi:transcription termination factor Rho